jgi:hypothetical protein
MLSSVFLCVLPLEKRISFFIGMGSWMVLHAQCLGYWENKAPVAVIVGLIFVVAFFVNA